MDLTRALVFGWPPLVTTAFETCFGWGPQPPKVPDPIAKTHLESRCCLRHFNFPHHARITELLNY